MADQVREDMAVMARILQKICIENGSEPEKVMGLDIVLGGRAVRNLFVDDYGVIFTLMVDQALKAAPKSEDAEEKVEKAVDEEWESARNELFGGKRSTSVTFLERGGRRGFDAKAVSQLREDLLEALRNTSNIRNVKDDHWVMFVVRGQGVVSEGKLRNGEEISLGEEGESTMVIKARKRDVDAYAKKGLPKEEFRKRVIVNTY